MSDEILAAACVALDKAHALLSERRDATSKAEVAEVRRRSWETRRAKYGPAGHAGYYSRPATRPDTRLGRLVALLLDDEILSEGQIARVIECDRVQVRRIADDGAASLRYRPLTGEWGAATMRRLIAKRG